MGFKSRGGVTNHLRELRKDGYIERKKLYRRIMFLAKISGNVVSTQKNDYLKGHKLLLVKKIDLDGKFIDNKDEIALDLIDSGIGDTVLVVKEGAAVQQMLEHSNAPVNTMIVAIVDDLDIQK